MKFYPWYRARIGGSLSSESPCSASGSNGSSFHSLVEMSDLSLTEHPPNLHLYKKRLFMSTDSSFQNSFL
uniref:Uncharacterized protein n=1 Tax=Rhizophora mucronata TaxID=61149 RepID=A0A2P2MLV2_RHIMU